MSLVTVVLFGVGMVVLAFADFSIKETAGKISPALGTLIYALVAAVPPLLWTIWTHLHGGITLSRVGVQWSVATGLAFGIFTGLMFLLFSQGVDLSIGTPVIRMGGIVLAATLGILVFKEGLDWQYVIGFVLAAIGIYLVASR